MLQTNSCKVSHGWSITVHLSLLSSLTCCLTWQPWYGATRETSLRTRFSEKPQLAGSSDKGTGDSSPDGQEIRSIKKKREEKADIHTKKKQKKNLTSVNQKGGHSRSWNAQDHWIISTLHRRTQTLQLSFSREKPHLKETDQVIGHHIYKNSKKKKKKSVSF